MTDQNKYNDQTRTVVSELVLSTNELTKYVISLLDSVSVDVDSLIVQLKAATDKIDAGVADLEEVRDKTLQDIHQAQEDISGVYEVFMQESQKLRNDLAGMYTQADDLDRRLDTLDGAQRDLETLYKNLGVLAKAIEADINTSNIKVRDIQGRIAQAETDITGLRAQLTSLATDLQKQQLSVADFESRMSVLEQKVTTAASDIRYISDQIAKCVADINTINQRVAESNIKSKDALALAETAYATVSSLTVDVGVLSTKLDQITNSYTVLNAALVDADANVSRVNGDVANLITSVNTTTTKLTNRLAAMESDLQAAGIKLDQANSLLTQLDANIATLNLDYQSLSVDVRNQISAATSAAKTANTSAESLAAQVSTLTAQMVDYTNQANQNIQHLNDDLVTAKTDLDSKIASTNQVLSDVRAEALSLNNDTRGLRNEVRVLSLDVGNKTVQITSIAQHVDEQKDYVDQRVIEIDTEYLHKLERAADAALLMGKEIGYFAHDGNFETKLDASTGVATMRGEIAALKDLMSVDNANLNSLQEIVDFIEQNRADLQSLGIANIAGLQAALDGKLAINGKAVDSTLFDGQAIGYFVHDGNFNTKLNTQAVITTIRSDITARSLTTHNHDGRYFRADADSSGAGNITITSTSSRAVNVQGNGSGVKGSLNAYSNGTGTGEVYVGKSDAIGGGMVFGGVADATAAGTALAGGGVNNLILYRQTAAGVREWTARNANNSNNWEFRGTILAQGVFDGANRVFSLGNLPGWANVTNKPAEATRWPTYAEVTGKPTEFTPAAHTHLWAHITDKPTEFAPSAHTHLWAHITDKPATYTPSAHNHYNVISQGRQTAWAGTTDPTYTGLSMVQAFANGYPLDYGNVLNLHGDVSGQIMLSDANKLMLRAKAAGGSWTDWTQVYTKLDRVDYTELLNVPTAFTPVAHAHPWAQITGVPAASVSAAGIVQLNSATNSTSATMAATSAAVKTAYDLAAGKVSKTSDTMSGTLTAANVLISGAQNTAANAVVRKDYADTKLAKDVSQYFVGHLLTKTANYMDDTGARDLSYSGFFRPNGTALDTLALPSLMIHVAHATSGQSHARGIGFDYGSAGWGAYVTRFDAAGVYLGKGKIYTEYDKPTAADLGVVPNTLTVNGKALSANIAITAADVGLGSVNNWGATSAINDASNTKYATAGAVKTAYDLAAAAMPKTGGIFSAGIAVNGSIFSYTGIIRSKVAGTTSGGIHIGGGNGYAEIAPMLNADTVPVWAQALRYYGPDDWRIGATSRIFHQNYLPTAAQVGALPITGVASNNTALGVERIPGVGMLMEVGDDNVPYISVNRAWRAVAFNLDRSATFSGEIYAGANRVFHAGNAPTAAQVGLGSVQNWTYSNSYTGGSASKYATEKAVTDAYNALNTAKASKGGDTFSAQMLFNSPGSINAATMANANAVFGTLTNGIGIDSNEIFQAGDNLFVGVQTGKDIQMQVAGTTKFRVTATGSSTDSLSANAVTLIGGPTMAYNSTTGCLEITFA